ncbi:hypothetical protein BGZ73_002758 [Actinomortierella ambigua]|nr:hypothetical protein BGZ73_002758 [Actinomortierella ambigua]
MAPASQDPAVEPPSMHPAPSPAGTLSQPTNSSLLTQSQEHYLKKYLLGVLINRELNLLQKQPYETLPHLGGPFDMLDEYKTSTTPFLRYLFESIVVPFPFLTSTNGALWPKLQIFMEEWAKVEASNGIEHEEMLRRKRLKNKGERTMVLMYSMAIKTVQQREKENADRLAQALQRTQIKIKNGLVPAAADPNESDPTDQHSLRETAKSQVATANSLHPDDARGRTLNHSWSNEHRSPSTARTPTRSPSPGIPTSTIFGVRINVVGVRTLKQEFPQYEFPLPPEKYAGKSGSNALRIGREKDRVMLRGYLHHLARVAPEVLASDNFHTFLTKDAISLSEAEIRDIEVRTALDEHRMEEQAKFDREVAKKVEEIDSQLYEVKQDLLQPGGVSRLFEAFRTVERVEDLPQLYQVVFEWGCMSFASTLYHVFTSSDDASINFSQLKRTHNLLPYRTMWGILKISNPMAMMKGLMELFLAQPFGSKSLLQRIITGNMNEEISEYRKDIAAIEKAVGDPFICEKIYNFVYAPNSVVSQIVSTDEVYDITELNLVLEVLKSDHIQPILTPMQIQAVCSAKQELEQEQYEALQKKMANSSRTDLSDSSDSDDTGSRSSLEDSDSATLPTESQTSKKGENLMQHLQQLLVSHLRIREKERMINLVFQGVTAEILKETITIFYQPLVKVYKSANVADSLFDVKDFTDELIKIVEQADSTNEGSSGTSNSRPSAASLYLNLVRKHLPSFYKFVHSVHKQDDGLFHDLLEWIESIISFMRTGYSRSIPDYITGKERRVAIDLDAFVKSNIPQEKWEVLQEESEALRKYFSEVKERKREAVRHMAGLDKATLHSPRRGRSPTPSFRSSSDVDDHDARRREQLRVSEELRGLGMQQEDVDELEMINFESFHINGDGDDEVHPGEQGLKVPKVPLVDTLLQPFVELMDRALFQSARE